MRINDHFDRHRSMRINRTLRNVSFGLAFVTLVFSVMSFTMIIMRNKYATWFEFAIAIFCFVLFANLGLHFHVSFKRKD